MEATEGAWFPVALNLAGRVVTSQVAKHHMSNAGLVYGTYQTGKAWSGKVATNDVMVVLEADGSKYKR